LYNRIQKQANAVFKIVSNIPVYLDDRSLYLLDTCGKSGDGGGGARLALWTQNINHGG
jgi:hypothetical protein